jgi:hypothetical protein
MSPVSHQTIQLSKGRHASPDEGACVVELASMLAGEHFSDHPNSVCPVIAALLRNYNDRIDDRRRQDLYPYAAKIVGSRASVGLERARARHLSDLVPERRGGLWNWLFGRTEPSSDVLAARVIEQFCRRGEDTHTVILGLVDQLLALDPQVGLEPDPFPAVTALSR